MTRPFLAFYLWLLTISGFTLIQHTRYDPTLSPIHGFFVMAALLFALIPIVGNLNRAD